jgi:hypothetical protein
MNSIKIQQKHLTNKDAQRCTPESESTWRRKGTPFVVVKMLMPKAWPKMILKMEEPTNTDTLTTDWFTVTSGVGGNWVEENGGASSTLHNLGYFTLL